MICSESPACYPHPRQSMVPSKAIRVFLQAPVRRGAPYSWCGKWRRKGHVMVWERNWGHNTPPPPAASLVFLLGLPVLASLQTIRPTRGIYSWHYTECLVTEKRSSGQILCLDLSKVERIQKPLQQIIIFPTPTWGHGLSFLKFSQYFTFLWEWGGGRGVEGLLSQFEEDSPFPTPGYCQHLHGGQLHSNHQSLPIYRAPRPLDH